jgi:hypothetical protein
VSSKREPSVRESLRDLLAQISADQDIASVTAEGTCDTRKCQDAIADRSAIAIIPPRKTAKPWKAATASAFASSSPTVTLIGMTAFLRGSSQTRLGMAMPSEAVPSSKLSPSIN